MHPRLILGKIASAMTSLAMNNAPISQGEWFVVLGPEHAASLADAGLDRPDIASYLFDHARIPAGVFRRHFSELAWAEWMKPAPTTIALPMTDHPDNIRVVVVGGPGKHSSLIPSWGMTRSVTIPVEADRAASTGPTATSTRVDHCARSPGPRPARLPHRGARQRQAERRRS